MLAKGSEEGIYFAFPRSTIEGIPIEAFNEHVSFDFVEVGCRGRGKAGHLKNKRELFYKFWGDNYKKPHNIQWKPLVFRTLAHFDIAYAGHVNEHKYSPDTIICCTQFTDEVLSKLDEHDREDIRKHVKTNKWMDEIDVILDDNAADGLYKLISDHRDVAKLAQVRGRLAELVIQGDIRRAIPAANFYRNSTINYFNKRYRNGTEIDAVTVFYGKQPYIEMIEHLRELDHLSVESKY